MKNILVYICFSFLPIISTVSAIRCHQCHYPSSISKWLQGDGTVNSNCFANPVGVQPTDCPEGTQYCAIIQLKLNGTDSVLRKCLNPSSIGYEDRVSCNEYVPSVGVNCVGNITDFKACFCSSEDGCNRDSVSVGGGGSGDCSCSGDCSSAISIVNYKAQIILLAFNSLVYMYFVTHR